MPEVLDAPTARPSRPGARFYYGWVNVVVAAVAMSATLPGRTYGLGLIKDRLCAELGVTDLRFNVLNFWAVLLGAAFILPVAPLIDRLGTRRVLAGVCALLGGCVLLMARAADDAQLFVTLTLVRGLGQGALSVVAIALVGKWFRRRAGLAMGVFSVLLAVGFVAPLGAVNAIVAASGWRAAWEAVGYAVLLLVPVGLLVARSSPEAYGVPPDEPADVPASPPSSLREAARTRAFWAYSAAATLFYLTFSAVTLDNKILLADHGLDADAASTPVMGALMVAGLAANLAAGFLSRRVSLGKLLAGGMALLAAALALFPFVATVPAAVTFGAAFGAAGGVVTVVYFAAYGHDYGRAHLGTLLGAVQALTVFASALGPVLLALCRDQTGGTAPFFAGTAALAVPIAAAAWLVKSR